MKYQLQPLALAAVTLWLCGCTTNSIKQSWKSPAYDGAQVRKICVLAVDQRALVREGMENRFVNQLRARGQDAMTTHQQLGLAEIKADKDAAAARARAAGADAVLIVRLVDQASYDRQVRATPALYTPTIAGYETYGWYDCYSVAFNDMGVVWSSSRQDIYLDTSLFDLKTGKRLWSALTLSVLKDGMDRLDVADSLVDKIVKALRKDSAVR